MQKTKRIIKIKTILMFLISLSFLCGCSSIESIVEPAALADNMAFVNSFENEVVGDQLNIDYKALPENSIYDENDVSFVFSDESLIKVDESTGRYICLKPGNLTVKILYQDKELDSKDIVIKPVLINKLFLEDIELGKSDSKKLEPIIEPANATNKNITMSIEDDEIAHVSGNVISAIIPGETVIHLQSEDGYSYDAKVKVFETDPESITFNKLEDEYFIEDKVDLSYLIEPEEGRYNPELLSFEFDNEY